MNGISFNKNGFHEFFREATFSMAIYYFILLADMFITGHFVGAVGVSAINIIFPAISLSTTIGQILGTGTAYVYIYQVGQFEREKAERTFGQGLITLIIASALQFLLFALLKNTYLDYLQISDAIRTEVEGYWKYEQYVLLLNPINFLLSETVHIDGDTLIRNISNAVWICCNVFLSIFLCTRIGISGVSLSGLIGMIICTMLRCIHFLRKSNSVRISLSFNWNALKNSVELSIVEAMPYLCWGVLNLSLNKMIIIRYGEDFLPVLAVVISILNLTIIFEGIDEALTPMAELYIREGNYVGEKELARRGAQTAIIEGFMTMELLFILAPVIPPLYGVTLPEMASLCESAIRILSLSLPFSTIIFLFSAQFRLVQKRIISIFMMLSSQLIMVVCFALLLSDRFGFKGLWYAFATAYAATIILFGMVVLCIYKKERFPWLCPMDDHKYINCSFILSRENVVSVCRLFTEFMRENDVPETVQFKANLLVEETGTLEFEKNKHRESLAEYTIGIRPEYIYIVTRDNGAAEDITKTVGNEENVQDILVEKLMEETEEKQYMLSAGFNRCYYKIPYTNPHTDMSGNTE